MTAPPLGLVVTRPTPTATLDLIVRAEQHGIRAVWSTVGGTNPDALTLFAAAATRTDQILLGTTGLCSALMPDTFRSRTQVSRLGAGRWRAR